MYIFSVCQNADRRPVVRVAVAPRRVELRFCIISSRLRELRFYPGKGSFRDGRVIGREGEKERERERFGLGGVPCEI